MLLKGSGQKNLNKRGPSELKKQLAIHEIMFVLEKHIAVLERYQTGWTKELNIVSWNGGTPKFDIRDWSPEHDHMSRGITLHEVEARALAEALAKHFESEVNDNED